MNFNNVLILILKHFDLSLSILNLRMKSCKLSIFRVESSHILVDALLSFNQGGMHFVDFLLLSIHLVDLNVVGGHNLFVFSVALDKITINCGHLWHDCLDVIGCNNVRLRSIINLSVELLNGCSHRGQLIFLLSKNRLEVCFFMNQSFIVLFLSDFSEMNFGFDLSEIFIKIFVRLNLSFESTNYLISQVLTAVCERDRCLMLFHEYGMLFLLVLSLLLLMLLEFNIRGWFRDINFFGNSSVLNDSLHSRWWWNSHKVRSVTNIMHDGASNSLVSWERSVLVENIDSLIVTRHISLIKDVISCATNNIAVLNYVWLLLNNAGLID